MFNQRGRRAASLPRNRKTAATNIMSKNNNKQTANNEKSGRVVRVTTKESFEKSVNSVIELVTSESFVHAVCERTENGKYKVTDSKPTDMDKVKTFEADGVKWYLVPTTDDKTAIATYIRYRLNKEKVANNNLNKEFANLTIEEKKQLLAMLGK